MRRVLRLLGQSAAYLLLAALIGHFSDSPAYQYFPADRALLRLVVIQGGERVDKCRRLSAAERAKLVRNMRKKFDCPRRRVPITAELSMDGAVLYHASRPPTGLSGDGPSKVYERFAVTPGQHHIEVRLRDSKRSEGYDFVGSADITLRAGQNYVIGFEKDMGGFQFGDVAAKSK